MTRESLKDKRLFMIRLRYATPNPVGSPIGVCPATYMAHHQHCAPPYQGSTTERHCANFTRRKNMLNPKNCTSFRDDLHRAINLAQPQHQKTPIM